jgi:hypothetical protein
MDALELDMYFRNKNYTFYNFEDFKNCIDVSKKDCNHLYYIILEDHRYDGYLKIRVQTGDYYQWDVTVLI